jgi:hypothetical protein
MGFELIPAIYEKSDQERIAASVMASAKVIHEKVIPENVLDEELVLEAEAESVSEFWSVLLGTIIKLALCFKHPSFCEEQEWRLLSLSPLGPVQFRGGRSGIIPFVRIPFEKSCITDVFQGPALDSRMTRRALEMYLAAEYAGRPRIKSSKIPLRSL